MHIKIIHSGLIKYTPFERDNSNNCCRFEQSNGSKSLHKTIVNMDLSIDVVNG